MTLCARRCAVAGLCAVTLGVASGCTSSHKHTDEATLLCQHALSGKRIASAQLDTVHNVREWKIGPGTRPAASAFPGATSRAKAAWCWTEEGKRTWAAYAAGPDGTAVKFGTLGGVGAPPSGPPAFP